MLRSRIRLGQLLLLLVMTHKHYKYYIYFLFALSAFNIAGQFLSFGLVRYDCNSAVSDVPSLVSNIVHSIPVSAPITSSSPVVESPSTTISLPSVPPPFLLGSFRSGPYRVADFRLCDNSTLRLYCPTNPSPSQFRSLLSQFKDARERAEFNFLNPSVSSSDSPFL